MATLTSLIQAVNDADSAPRLIAAVQSLAATNQPEAIPTLIATLSYNNPGAAVAAVEGLVRLGVVAVQPLLELLDLHNYTARSWAIRALACIGDPRGLVTLLGVTATDFAPSVRRSAVRGLGLVQWHAFPEPLLGIAWAETLTSLLDVAHQDEEWVVRYAAVVSLQDLGLAMHSAGHLGSYAEILRQLAIIAEQETILGVKGRIWLAQQHLQNLTGSRPKNPTETHPADQSAPLTDADWQKIASQLQMFQTERQAAVA